MANEAAAEIKPSKGGKGGIPLVPLILVVLFIPVITLALTEFVIIPRLQSSLGGGEGKDTTASSHGAASGVESHSAAASPRGEGEEGTISYGFEDIVCNLSGTMGTRFLKVSFEVVGSDSQMPDMIRMKKPQVKDAIITTLSSKTIQDIEVPGGRNALRVALISAINQAIGFAVVEQLYFTEFLIQ